MYDVLAHRGGAALEGWALTSSWGLLNDMHPISLPPSIPTHTHHREEELQKRVGELQGHLANLKVSEESTTTTALQKRKLIDACERRLEEVREARKNCDRAVRILKDPTKRNDGKEMLRGMDKRIRHCQDEVRRAELNLNYADSHTVHIDHESSDGEYKNEIDRVQGGMKESYARQLQTLDRTLDVASKARDNVEAQGQQLHSLATETARIGDGLERADFVVRRFKRQVSSDRICQVLVVGNLLVFIALLTLVILNRKPILHTIGL